jgi:excisionase family DNA binding protein
MESEQYSRRSWQRPSAAGAREDHTDARHWDRQPDLLTPSETAALLRISRTACYEALRAGELRPLRITWGRRILVSKQALRALLDEKAGR